jgi:hypothetical protein
VAGRVIVGPIPCTLLGMVPGGYGTARRAGFGKSHFKRRDHPMQAIGRAPPMDETLKSLNFVDCAREIFLI